jgi:NADH-quinone oxidoreductase subunit I
VIGILRGFTVTWKHLFGPGITGGYPQVMPNLPERARGSVGMVFGEDGSLLCRACELCARECPDDALIVEFEKPAEGGGRVLTRFSLHLGRCMMCGLCVESCVSNALTMTKDFENDTHDPTQLVRVLYRADSPPEPDEVSAPS